MSDQFFELDSTAQLMWLVGLLEGEAHFGCRPSNGRGMHLAISVGMTDEDIVNRIAKIWGTKVSIYDQPKAEWSRVYRTAAVGYNAERWMNAVLPFMGDRRAEAIKKALTLWESTTHKRENNLPSECGHTDRPASAKGLCKSCYSKKLYREGRLSIKPSEFRPKPANAETVDMDAL